MDYPGYTMSGAELKNGPDDPNAVHANLFGSASNFVHNFAPFCMLLLFVCLRIVGNFCSFLHFFVYF